MSTQEIINENPTILSAADLPTRRSETQTKSSKGSLRRGQFLNVDSIPSFPTASELLRDPFAASPGEDSAYSSGSSDADEDVVEEIDEQEIYDLISTISDPEHPLSLGELAVINLPHIKVTHGKPTPINPTPTSHVLVEITPTITHCSLATVIGLGVRVRLEQALPPRFRIDVRIREGTHQSTEQVNKQLNDKERVAAACENETLMGVLGNMLSTCK